MENQSEYIEDLRIIKKVMEESSRFLSLSGLSGIFAGLIAIAGAAVAVFVFLDGGLILSDDFFKSYTVQGIKSAKDQPDCSCNFCPGSCTCHIHLVFLEEVGQNWG